MTASSSRLGRSGAHGVAVVSAALLGSVFVVAPASANTPAPATPSHVHATSVSSSAFTVVVTSAHATKYRLYASTTRSSVYVANLSRARHSALSSKPRMTLGSLSYTSQPYFYRVVAINGTHKRYSGIFSVGLRPAVPTAVVASSGPSGTSVRWNSGSAGGYIVSQGTNAAMTTGRRDYAITSQTHAFTPYGLRSGQQYFFQVRAFNGGTRSGFSSLASVVPTTAEQNVRVATYNILRADSGGQREGDGTVAPWSRRRSAVAALITQAAPDAVAIEEGSDWVGAVRGPRQVDDLVAALGGSYSLARTEVPPTESHYFRTGRYILYKASVYRPVGTGGHWTLGAGRFAAYQILENRATGARFLFVAVHLDSGSGASADGRRQDETESLLRQARAYAGAAALPVVYAGDFNSHGGSNHVFDGPALAFGAAHVADGLQVAQSLYNQKYDSANDNYRTAPAFGRSIDHIYAPPGVALRSWRLWLNVRGGKFTGQLPSDHNPLSSDVTFPYFPR